MDDEARPVNFLTNDRYADLPCGLVRAEWATHIQGWRSVGAWFIFSRGHAVWNLPDGPLDYLDIALAPGGVQYHVAPLTSARDCRDHRMCEGGSVGGFIGLGCFVAELSVSPEVICPLPGCHDTVFWVRSPWWYEPNRGRLLGLHRPTGVGVSSQLAGAHRLWAQRTRHGLTSLYARGRGATVARGVSGPEFIIIGTQRGGTTSLYRSLVAHPDVVAPLTKEIHYFSSFYHRGPCWYRGHFAERDGHQRTFEASPYYLAHPEVPQRVAADLPGTRFVALLRDPVERAYSHYQHNIALGLERLSFADAIAAEPDRLAAAVPTRSRAWTEDARRRYSYVTRGLYAEQLQRWYAHVDPERILVLRSEDLYEYPAATYATVIDFVGLRPLAATESVAFDVHNHWPSSTPSQLTPELRSQLRRVFEPHSEELRQMSLGTTWT